MLDFRRITPFCLEKRLSKHKITVYSKNLGGHGPFSLPDYAYGKQPSTFQHCLVILYHEIEQSLRTLPHVTFCKQYKDSLSN